MQTKQSFTATASVTANSPAGGTVAVASPSAGVAGAMLLLSNPAASIACVRFAGTAAFAPNVLDPGLADLTLNPGSQILVTAPAQIGAAYLIVSGSLTIAAGTLSTSITINS